VPLSVTIKGRVVLRAPRLSHERRVMCRGKKEPQHLRSAQNRNLSKKSCARWKQLPNTGKIQLFLRDTISKPVTASATNVISLCAAGFRSTRTARTSPRRVCATACLAASLAAACSRSLSTRDSWITLSMRVSNTRLGRSNADGTDICARLDDSRSTTPWPLSPRATESS